MKAEPDPNLRSVSRNRGSVTKKAKTHPLIHTQKINGTQTKARERNPNRVLERERETHFLERETQKHGSDREEEEERKTF